LVRRERGAPHFNEPEVAGAVGRRFHRGNDSLELELEVAELREEGGERRGRI